MDTGPKASAARTSERRIRRGAPKPLKIGKDAFATILRQHGHTKEEANEIVGKLFDQIETALLRGHSVSIANIGTLTVKQTKPRTGKFPNSDHEFTVPAGRKVTFKISSNLKKRL